MDTVTPKEKIAIERVVTEYVTLSKVDIRKDHFDTTKYMQAVDYLTCFLAEDAATVDPERYSLNLDRLEDAFGPLQAQIMMLDFYSELFEQASRIADVTRYMNDAGRYVWLLAKRTETV